MTQIERPIWCNDQTCIPLNCFNMEGDTDEKYASCIGKLQQPANHGKVKAINDLSWCMLSQGQTRWLINQDDCISFVILMAGVLKRAGKPFPKWLLEELNCWAI